MLHQQTKKMQTSKQNWEIASATEEIITIGTPVHTPVNIYNDMQSCLGNVNGLGVVRFGEGLWAMHSTAAPFSNVQMWWAGYSIFAAAPERDNELP